MRITQRTMFNTHITNMNSTQSAYMESLIQGSSQKRINRPSDDPAGMALILNTRNDINRSTQFEKNSSAAQGWLNLSDQTLSTQVSTTLAKIKELAVQASNGTYLAENRDQIASQLKEYMGQLLNLSNTQYGNKSIFAGHKYDESAFDEALAVTAMDPALKDKQFQVSGKSENTQLVQFTSGGNLDPNTVPNDPIDYRWTDDGGETWETGTYTPAVAPNNSIQMDGVTLTLPSSGVITPYVAPTQGEPSTPSSGSSLMVRPSAIYNGDTKDAPPETINMGGPNGMTSSATGTFTDDVIVRFDANANLWSTNEDVTYSYSEDNGRTWTQATVKTDGSGEIRLPAGDGYIDVDTPAASVINADTQLIIHPNRANLGFEIMDDAYISVNQVGKDIFGGLYGDPPQAVEGLKGNLFETVGELIGYCETNNAAGVAESLDKITDAHAQVLNAAAEVGGLKNRVSLAQDVLSFQKLNSTERLSYTEDFDLTELLAIMAQQELAFSTVLNTSSKIMQMGLVNYL